MSIESNPLHKKISHLLKHFSEARCTEGRQEEANRLQEELQAWIDNLIDINTVLVRDNRALEAITKRYKEALRPFAQIGSLVEYPLDIAALIYGKYEATYADLKRAADALEGKSE